ncbi:MAG: hypothetical protein Q9170_001840 [Blastenia crenularia]
MSPWSLANNTSIMGDAWVGPGARTSPMNEEANRMHEAIKQQIKFQEQQKREEENARRAEKGWLPCEYFRYCLWVVVVGVVDGASSGGEEGRVWQED